MATFDDVKKMLNGYVDKGHLSYNDAAKIIKKWKKRENRRVHRQMEKQIKAIIYLYILKYEFHIY